MLGSTSMSVPSSRWLSAPRSCSSPRRWNFRGESLCSVCAARSRRIACWPTRASSRPSLVARSSIRPWAALADRVIWREATRDTIAATIVALYLLSCYVDGKQFIGIEQLTTKGLSRESRHPERLRYAARPARGPAGAVTCVERGARTRECLVGEPGRQLDRYRDAEADGRRVRVPRHPRPRLRRRRRAGRLRRRPLPRRR